MMTSFSLLLYKCAEMLESVHKKTEICFVLFGYLTSEGKLPVTGSGGNLKGVFAETDWLLTISVL